MFSAECVTDVVSRTKGWSHERNFAGRRTGTTNRRRRARGDPRVLERVASIGWDAPVFAFNARGTGAGARRLDRRRSGAAPKRIAAGFVDRDGGEPAARRSGANPRPFAQR